MDRIEYGSTQAVAKTLNVSYKAAKSLIYNTADGKTKTKMAAWKKKKDAFHTEWPEKISNFCLTKPVCSKCPGDSVSIGYRQTAEKYIRQFSVSKIFGYFLMKYPTFPYKRTSSGLLYQRTWSMQL